MVLNFDEDSLWACGEIHPVKTLLFLAFKPGCNVCNLLHNFPHNYTLARAITFAKLCIMATMVKLMRSYVANYAPSAVNGSFLMKTVRVALGSIS